MKGVSIKRRAKDAVKNLITEAAKLNYERLEIGIIDGSEKHSDSGMSVAAIAAVNEFGRTFPNRIPPRPFIGPSMNKNQDKYVAIMAKEAPRVLLRLGNSKAMYHKIGKMAVLDIKHFIKDGKFEPLSAQQIKKKGHAAPLFHTFQMMDALDYKVNKK